MSVGRSTLIVAGTAAVSRVLGFVRDVLTAALFGAGPVADALLLALRFPTYLRRVLAEGGLNAGFVPIYARLARGGPDAAGRFATASLATIGLAVLVLAAVVHIAAPWIILAIGGYGHDPAVPALATGYLRAAMPFMVGASIASLVGAWLNAERDYIAAALAPLAVNVLLIAVLAVLILYGDGDPRAGVIAAASWSLAGLAQLAMLIPAMRRLPLRPTGLRALAAADQRSLLLRALPAMVASGAAQLVVLAATAIASQTPGAIAWLYYAERLLQMPLGFISVAAGIVILPEIAARLSASDRDAANVAQNRALEAMMALALPASAALWVLSDIIISVLFQHGAFDAQDSRETAAVLAGLAPGLAAASAGKVLSQTAFAEEDVIVPTLAAGAGILATLAVGFGLPGYGAYGLGLAVSVGLAAHVLALALILLLRGRWRPDRRLAVRCAGLAAASAGMALLVGFAARHAVPLLSPGTPGALRALALLGLCALGVAVYAALATLLRAIDWREAKQTLARR